MPALSRNSPLVFLLDHSLRSFYSSGLTEANLPCTFLALGSRGIASDRSTERIAVIGWLGGDMMGLPGTGVG